MVEARLVRGKNHFRQLPAVHFSRTRVEVASGEKDLMALARGRISSNL
jgi:hypothetical protein